MTQGAVVPVMGFEHAERFPAALDFGSALRPMMPLIVLLAAGTWVLLALLLMFLFGPLAGLLSATVLHGGVARYLYRLRHREFTQLWADASLELSPTGAVVTSRWVRTELPWAQVRRIGRVLPPDPLRLNFGPDLADVVGADATRPSERTPEALIGTGSRIVTEDAPAGTVALLDRIDPPEQPRTITLTHFDRQWRSGRIGDWVRAYRPDLIG